MARLSFLFPFLALAACSQPPSMVDMNAAVAPPPPAPNARASTQGHPQGGNPAALEKCSKADWSATGYRHGVSGFPLGALKQVTDACEGTGVKVDRLAYSTGRLKGLALFCSTESGYRRAREGHPLENNCPPTLAEAYAEGHARGVLHR